MITDLALTASFEASGFTTSRSFPLKPGITAVVGPNGVGKSTTTIELARALLFGQAARRGKAASYKQWDARGTFVINGEPYTITRNAKREEIVDGAGTVLATGAKAVTAKVEELLGYGLTVFDICNASVQKQGDNFGKMQPAERKRLIDRVVGLTSDEAVEKQCRDEARGLRREAEALEKTVRHPVEPVQPKGYRYSDLIGTELDLARGLYDEAERLRRDIREFPHPLKPTRPSVSSSEIQIVQGLENERTMIEKRRRELESFLQRARPFFDGTLEDVEKAKARLAKRKLIDAAGLPPFLSQDEIDQAWQEWHLVDAHTASDEVECPNCLFKFRPTGEEPIQPVHSKDELRRAQTAINKWAGLDDKLPEGRDMTDQQIATALKALTADEEMKSVRTELNTLVSMPDRSAQLADLRAVAAEWEAYNRVVGAFTVQKAASDAAQSKLDALGHLPTRDDLDALSEALRAAERYEADVVRYEEDARVQRERSATIADKLFLADEFSKGAAGLADARAVIKAFLAPRLSEVASKLLSDMTLGKLTNVVVDDEMNITVNGQDVETLSGGGETVANIALRIALGQVLVAQTFPVFLGDEIDADTDNVRREAVINAMVGLKDHLQQIILVTHRDVSVADHVLDLEH